MDEVFGTHRVGKTQLAIEYAYAHANDYDLVWPAGPLPLGIPGHVIVTTRRSGFTALGHVMDLDVINPRTQCGSRWRWSRPPPT